MKAELRMLACTVALIAGEAIAFALPAASSLHVYLLFIALLAGLYGYGHSVRGWHYAVIGITGAALAFGTIDSHTRFYDALEERAAGEPARLELKVERVLRPGSFLASADGIGFIVSHPRNMASPVEGERWECTGWAGRRPENIYERMELKVFGAKTGMRRLRGIDCFRRFRNALSRRMGIGLEREQETADLNRAILLGERARLDRALRSVFVDAGTMHIFAISGLHVMIVAGVLFFILGLCCVPYRLMPLALNPALWMYVLVTGSPSSAVRAALMASFYFSAVLFRRQPNGLLAWAFSFLIVYAVDPMRFYDIGCALSFAVMLGLILSGGVITKAVRDWRQYVLLSFAAWCAGMPIAAHVFGRITPGGIIANLLLIPLVSFSVTLAFLGSLAGFVSETLAAHLNNFSGLFTRAMLGISSAVASIPFANIEIRPWPIVICIEIYAVMLLVLILSAMIMKRRHRTL